MTQVRDNNSLCTPEWIVDLVECVDVIALDPCSNPWSVVRAEQAWTLHDGNDGLTKSWLRATSGRLTYVNPPYGPGHLLPWAQKTVLEAGKGVEIIDLVPGSFDTEWWQTLGQRVNAIAYLNDRVKHGGGEHGGGMFPSALHYFGPRPFRFLSAFEDVADVRLVRPA
jgi:hypothetical protein